ncbi:hypothetical protein [Mesorhizobium sp. SP-1A]|uniref:hypothetical protein n=1 Tax=Mesorhizobium sp. SP-1A TaxID=3077840 RepID=UPI0028F6DBAF|nr:hypothetical protein [Mesorhizobium sp. SP-1A]
MKYAFVLATAIVSLSTAGAYAGGCNCGSTKIGGSTGISSGLINVSPSIGLGNISALNGIANGNAILSGNVISGILSGNKTGVLNGVGGVLNGLGVNLLGSNASYKLGRH